VSTKFNNFKSHDKILHYPDKLNLFVNAGKTLIVTELDPTNRCNNKCPLCTGVNGIQAELTFDEINEIVRSLKALGNQGVIISGGGEPLIHPDIIALIKLICENEMKVGLNSNGLALTPEIAETIAQNCEYFRISLDAGTASTYKLTHGMEEPDFIQVIENIKIMAQVKKKSKSTLSFVVGFLTNQQTIHDMEGFILLCKECGVDAAQFRPFTGDSTDISNEYERLKEKYETENFKILCSKQKYETFGTERAYKKCHGMFFSTVITANARMYACLHHRQNEDFLICDMRKGESIIDMWNYRKWIVYHDMNMENCPPYCRNDSFNAVLENLLSEYPHREFL
jgi:MoaA/NifB/PqqE/SkfB family radical SAM enzyme